MYRTCIPCTLNCAQEHIADTVIVDIEKSKVSSIASALNYPGLEKFQVKNSSIKFYNSKSNPTTDTSIGYQINYVYYQGSYSESDGATINAEIKKKFIFPLISNNQNFKQNLNCTKEIDMINYQIFKRVIK